MGRGKNASTEQRIAQARARLGRFLQDRGLRSTQQRDAVLRVFLERDAHVSAEELYERLRQDHPSIGHATVYRTMGLFVEAGIAKERRFHEGRVRYEPGVDAGHHDHLVCLHCGDIQEFEDPTIEQIQRDVAESRGFEVRYHRLELYGLCALCREQDLPNQHAGESRPR